MSTNHTPHFNLSQWEPDDQVVRAEFNENHAKIEHAFFNHSSAELIGEKTITEENLSRVDFDVSQLDWSRYLMLIVSAQSASSGDFRLYLGGAACVCAASAFKEVDSGSCLAQLSYATHMDALIPILYHPNHIPTAFAAGSGEYNSQRLAVLAGGGGYIPLNQCRSILVDHSTYQPGDRVVLWGVK